MSELLALMDGQLVGTVIQHAGRLKFLYDDNWRSSRGAYPLSLCMPLAAREHPHAAIAPFLWGLLPDNEFVLARWGQRFQVSPRNPFALISHVGEDCAGAVQFVRPERVEAVLGGAPGEVAWLSEADIAQRLRLLKEDASAGRSPSDPGQFSLAGAQPKTALLFDGLRWGVPSGRTPTTHILKPSTSAFVGHAENEHFCLQLASAFGLPVAKSQVRQFEDTTAIVVERYDRVDVAKTAAAKSALAAAKAAEAAMSAAELTLPARMPDIIIKVVTATAAAKAAGQSADQLLEFAKIVPICRVHQEDFCQALRVHPSLKYQNDGGPGPKQIIDLIRAHAPAPVQDKYRGKPAIRDEDVMVFLDALIFNWLVCGTDAHAKNYSLLIGGGGLVRLAPFYDIATILAYPDIDPRKAKLAMKIGDAYGVFDIGIRDWLKLSSSLGIAGDALVFRIREMIKNLPGHIDQVSEQIRKTGLLHPVLHRLAETLKERATELSRL